MTSWYLNLLIMILVSLVNSSSSSKSPRHRLSPNTHNFIYRDLRIRAEDVQAVRSGAVCTQKPTPTVFKASKPETVTTVKNETLVELRNELIRSILLSNNYIVEEILFDLYNDFPGIDHINEVYEDEESGTSRGLLHFAILAGDSALIKIFGIHGELDPTVVDSFNYTPMEFAFNQGRLDLMYFLIRNLRISVLVPFLGYETLVHYAAHNDRVDLLKECNRAAAYHFEEICSEDWNPLELALVNGKLNAAKFLIKVDAFHRPIFIQSAHLHHLKNFEKNHQVALFMCSQYDGLVYLKNEEGMDLLLLAINHENVKVIKEILNSGFNEIKAEYNLKERAAQLTNSTEILSLLSKKIN